MSQEEMKLLTLIQFEFIVLPTGTSVNGGEINSASKQTKKNEKKKTLEIIHQVRPSGQVCRTRFRRPEKENVFSA